MIISTRTFKIQGLYCAYAPERGVFSYGGCFEEAVNSLHDELQARHGKERSRNGQERKSANAQH